MSHESLRALRAIHLRGPLKTEAAHAAAGLTGLNRTLAVAITRGVGSMWTAYLFVLLALVSLPAVLATVFPGVAGFFPKWLLVAGLIALVAWVAQTFFQLVLLPVIIVGQNVQTEASDQQRERDHQILGHQVDVLADLHKLQLQQTAILQRLDPEKS